MRNRAIAVVLLLALAGLLGWMLWPPAHAPVPSDEGEVAAQGRSPVVAAEPVAIPDEQRRPRRPRPEPTERTDDQADAPEPVAPPGEHEDSAGPPEWELVLLGPNDAPAVGVPIQVQGWEDSEGSIVVAFPDESKAPLTDAEGRVRLGRFEPGVVRVASAALPTGHVDVTKPKTVLRVRELLPLELRVVNGQTGGAVEGARLWITSPGAERVQVPEDRTTVGAFTFVSSARGGEQLVLRYEVEPPPGVTTTTMGRLSLTGLVSRMAKSLRAEVVLRPTTRVRVRVVEEDGTPVAGAEVGVAACGMREFPHPEFEPSDAHGVIAIDGVPFLRGESVWVSVAKEGRTGWTRSIVLSEPDRIETADITLAVKAVATSRSVVGVGGGAGGAFGGRRGVRRTLQARDGRVEVLVLRRDGTPAANTLVVGSASGRARTDASGRVAFEHVPPGEFTLTVDEPGFHVTPQTVVVAAGETVQVTLTEGGGRSATVQVVDGDGFPLPFAWVSVALTNGKPYVAMDGDVQWMRRYTGVDGVCELHGLPTEDVHVTARFGSRSAEGTLRWQLTLTLEASR